MQNKNMNSKGKLKNSRRTPEELQTTTSSQMSAEVSTSRGPGCVPYWINVTKDWPTKLLSGTKIDSRDLDSTCWNSCFKNLVSNCNCYRSRYSNVYDCNTNGFCTESSEGDMKRVFSLCIYLDKLISRAYGT